MPLYVGDNEIFGGNASSPEDTKVNDLEIKVSGVNDFSASVSLGKSNEGAHLGQENTALGGFALSSINGGNKNTGIGSKALQAQGTNYSTAVGVQAGATSTGDYNTSVGMDAYLGYSIGGNVPTGEKNTIIGARAGYQLDGGSNNVFVGYEAGTGQTNTNFSIRNGSGNVLIGSNVLFDYSDISDHVILGSNNTTDLFCMATTIQSLSDERDKKAIKGVTAGLDLVNDLRPVEFIWEARDKNFQRNGSKDCGFIAQELKEVQEKYGLSEELKLVNDTTFIDKMTASPARLLPILVKAIQEMSNKIELLESKLERNGIYL